MAPLLARTFEKVLAAIMNRLSEPNDRIVDEVPCRIHQSARSALYSVYRALATIRNYAARVGDGFARI